MALDCPSDPDDGTPCDLAVSIEALKELSVPVKDTIALCDESMGNPTAPS